MKKQGAHRRLIYILTQPI